MTRFVSGFSYYVFYTMFYLSPFIILFIIDEASSLNVSKYLERFGSLRQIIGLVFLAYAIFLPSYRAKLASEAYGDRDVGFWEAHTISGAILKTHLSFLPIIGRLFEKKSQ